MPLITPAANRGIQIICTVQMVMPMAPKPKEGKHLEYVKELPDGEYLT